jgi:hypothetical protein
MANSVLTKQTSLSGEEVFTRAVQFFSTEKWRATTQSTRSATFEGKPPLSWFLLLVVLLSFFCFVLPGLILYFIVIRRSQRRFLNLVITTTPLNQGTEVTVTYPGQAKNLTARFLAALPELATP